LSEGDVQALEDHIRSLTTRLEMADWPTDQLRADHAAELEQVCGELERTRQDADRRDRQHREQWAEVEHLLKALVERVEAEQARLIEERDHLRDELQEARAEADHAKADQVRMARDVAAMFDELKAMADRRFGTAAPTVAAGRQGGRVAYGKPNHRRTSLLAFNRARRRRCRSRRLSAVSFRRPACRRARAQATLRCRSAVARSSAV
jgi:hypothetical protein